MQVLRGSQEMGRVEHGRFGDQTGADPERVEEAKKIMPLDYVVLDPGDALFRASATATYHIARTRTARPTRAGR